MFDKSKTMDSQAEAHWIYEELLRSNDPSVIQFIKNFLLSRKSDSERLSIEEYNDKVNDSLAQYRRSESISHEELLDDMKKW